MEQLQLAWFQILTNWSMGLLELSLERFRTEHRVFGQCFQMLESPQEHRQQLGQVCFRTLEPLELLQLAHHHQTMGAWELRNYWNLHQMLALPTKSYPQ